MQWIREGIHSVAPKNVISMLNAEEIECRAAGDKVVDIEKLKGITHYYGAGEESKYVTRFWKVLGEMTEELKQAYLKFVWGRQRLPVDCSNLRYKHCIQLVEWGDGSLPMAHTCFFMIDLP